MKISNFFQKKNLKVGIALLFLFVFVFFSFLKKEEDKEFTEVIRKNLTQRVSISGQVIPLRDIDLQFQIQGKVDGVEVEAGESIKRGDVLISLDNNELSLEVSLMKAAQDIALANLTKILEGASSEEVQVYESTVKKAEAEKHSYQIALSNTEINLENIQKTADQNLENSYEDTLNTLSSAHIKIFNAHNVVDEIQRSYFISNTQDGIIVKEKVDQIEESINQEEDYLNTAISTRENEDIDTAIIEIKQSLELTSESLRVIREIAEKAAYRSSISSADKTSIDNQRAYINTILASVIDAQQNIDLVKITNISNINSAQTSLDSTQELLSVAIVGLEYAENKLSQIKAGPQQYDIDLYQAKLNQADVALAQSKEKLSKTILITPCDGIVSDIYIDEGEIAKTTDIITSLVCENTFQVEAEVPESDIGKISLQDKVEISLDAFYNQDFFGKIIKIYPTETIIQGVVYYKVKIIFDDFNELIKSGMTTDLEIITQEKENVLVAPQRLIIKKNGNRIAKVLVGDEVIEVMVETGINNDQGEIEIISGLKEGDKIIK